MKKNFSNSCLMKMKKNDKLISNKNILLLFNFNFITCYIFKVINTLLLYIWLWMFHFVFIFLDGSRSKR